MCCTDDATVDAHLAHKVAAAAKEVQSVACILEPVYAEAEKGNQDLSSVSPMCLWTNPLCGQEDSPLLQTEATSLPHQVHAHIHHDAQTHIIDPQGDSCQVMPLLAIWST